MLNAWVTVCGGAAWSVTCAVKLAVPNAVGDPLKQPLVCSVSPVGSAPPATVQVRVPTPLLALRHEP